MVKYRADQKKTLVCLDSYQNGIPKGRIYSSYKEVYPFESLTQFLLRMEGLLDDQQMPQASTSTRSFAGKRDLWETTDVTDHIRRGSEVTFEVRIIYRHHSSWQGAIFWLDRNMVQNFRSVLELIQLMDSALRTVKESDSA